VYLYVKSGPAEAMNAPHDAKASVVLDQKGCVYTPHVIAVAAGGYVEFRNEDPTMHNIHTMPTMVGNETVDVSQGPRGAAQTKQFKAAEAMIPVRCNNHPWMNAFINVSATPFFAVSDGAGHFEIHGLPAGEYVLGAVHEKMGEQTMQVTVKAGGNTHADFAFAIH
jgi:plastocyanin